MKLFIALWPVFDLVPQADAGSPFMWHRAWALQQETSRDKQYTGAVYDAVVGCEEEYCNYAKDNKCDLDCVVPEHGCADYCYRNKNEYRVSKHPQAKYYICSDGRIRGKDSKNPSCKANGFPFDKDPKDSTSRTCCGYFSCNGGPKGACNPSSIRIQCQKEAEGGGNPKLVGCLKQINNKMDRSRRYPDNMKEFLSYPGGDMSVAVPWQAGRRRKYAKCYTSAEEGPVIGSDGSGPLPKGSPGDGGDGGDGCARRNGDCLKSKCCQNDREKCYELSPGSAACRKRCKKKRDFTCNILSKVEDIDIDQLQGDTGTGDKAFPRNTALLAMVAGVATGLGALMGLAGFVRRSLGRRRIAYERGSDKDDTDVGDAVFLDSQ